MFTFIHSYIFINQSKNDLTYLLLCLTDVIQHFVQLWFADQRTHAGAVQ